ncbi:MAG: response regulator [Vicinamibacterales bacterium]
MPKVMVVDDDADIRKLLSVWLRSGGFEVVVAVDGYQAVQVARSGVRTWSCWTSAFRRRQVT